MVLHLVSGDEHLLQHVRGRAGALKFAAKAAQKAWGGAVALEWLLLLFLFSLHSACVSELALHLSHVPQRCVLAPALEVRMLLFWGSGAAMHCGPASSTGGTC